MTIHSTLAGLRGLHGAINYFVTEGPTPLPACTQIFFYVSSTHLHVIQEKTESMSNERLTKCFTLYIAQNS